jgi:hypothetical protein
MLNAGLIQPHYKMHYCFSLAQKCLKNATTHLQPIKKTNLRFLCILCFLCKK